MSDSTVPRLPLSPEVAAIARRVVWFETPQQAIENSARFMAYVMTYGTFEDVSVLRRYWSDEELRTTLDAAPPGIFDDRSWAYWNAKLGRYPAPQPPKRKFDA